MVAEKLLIDVLRGEIETLSKGTVNELSYEYMIEAQFNSLWNRVLIPNQVKQTVVDSIEDFAVYAVIDDYLANLTAEVCPVIVSGCITASKDK